MKLLPKIMAAAVLFAAPAFGALAHDFKAGELEVQHPASRATLPGQKVAGGFFTVINGGGQADRLVSITSPVSDDVQLHDMIMENDVMKMRHLEGGIEIPAGGTVELKRGGLHVMFMDIKQPLKEGDKFQATLNFEKSGPLPVEFNVEAAKPAAAKEGEAHKM